MSKSNRRKFIGTAAVLAAGTAATAIPLKSAKKNYPVVHHVFFWLKNAGSMADRDQLIAGVKKLSAIPTVRALHVGMVASKEKRDVVDNRIAAIFGNG